MDFKDRLQKLFSRDSWLSWALITAGILLYLNSLPNEMFWDDDDFILNNAYIKDWQHWPHYFKNNILSGTHLLSNYWRPLLQAVFAVEWHLWADWPPGWRLVNILTHSSNAVLLFMLLRIILKDRALSFLTAAMFLIHPAQNETVVYPNSLGDALANFFVFGGLIFFARFRSSGTPAFRSADWWLTLAAYPLALMSKETAILFLPYLILCDWMLRPKEEPFRQKIVAITKAAWPFLIIAIGYIALRATVLNFNNSFNFYKEENILTSNFGVRILTFFRVISIYAGILLTPYDLRVERLIDPATSLLLPDVILGAATFSALVWLAVRFRNRAPIITFGTLWFFAGILPTSNLFVLINALVYEHFLYTALIGIWLVIFWVLLRWSSRSSIRKRLIIALLSFIFSAFAVRVVWRNTDWRTAIVFYEKLLPTAEKSYRVINNLGMEYAEKGLVDKAEATYNIAITLDPNNAVAYHNLANIYRDRAKRGDPQAREKAISLFEKTISLQENFVFSYKSLAQLYLDKGNYSDARRVLEKYFYLANEKIYTIESLTKIAVVEENWPEAKRYLETLLKLKPGDPVALSALRQIDLKLKKTNQGTH